MASAEQTTNGLSSATTTTKITKPTGTQALQNQNGTASSSDAVPSSTLRLAQEPLKLPTG